MLQRIFEENQVELERFARLVEARLARHGHRPEGVKRLGGFVVARVGVDSLASLLVNLWRSEEIDEIHPVFHLCPDIFAVRLVDELHDELISPVLVLVRGELVAKNSLALVPPQRHQVRLGGLDLASEGLDEPVILSEPVALGEDQALEHLAELSHVEQVVELGRRRKHLGLNLVPQVDGDGHQLGRDVHNLR